jgi:RES domain-containing protein
LTRVYRVLRKPYARTPFDGEGAYRYGGRWSSVGTRLAYSSEHESLALLEYFVHLDAGDPPDDLVLAVADIPDGLEREQIAVSKLPANWGQTPAPAELSRFGDEFARRAECCVLAVPSALAPSENNCLLNPQHPQFREIVIHPPKPISYDPRMFGARRGKKHHK